MTIVEYDCEKCGGSMTCLVLLVYPAIYKYTCNKCGVVENADANAGFNIAHLYREGMSRFSKERDLLKGSTDTPKGEML